MNLQCHPSFNCTSDLKPLTRRTVETTYKTYNLRIRSLSVTEPQYLTRTKDTNVQLIAIKMKLQLAHIGYTSRLTDTVHLPERRTCRMSCHPHKT